MFSVSLLFAGIENNWMCLDSSSTKSSETKYKESLKKNERLRSQVYAAALHKHLRLYFQFVFLRSFVFTNTQLFFRVVCFFFSSFSIYSCWSQTRGIYSYFFLWQIMMSIERRYTHTHEQPKEQNEREKEEQQQIERTHNKEITVILLHLMKNSLFFIRSQIALGKVVVFSYRIS